MSPRERDRSFVLWSAGVFAMCLGFSGNPVFVVPLAIVGLWWAVLPG